MKREVSNSMSIENDPHFKIITPVCKACRNLINQNIKNDCKIYCERPKEYAYAKRYDCPERDIDINSINYDAVKDKL